MKEDELKCLLIYSGGMDSTVLLHDFKDSVKLAVSFNYGSKHNDREYSYAVKNTQKLGILHKRIDLRSAMRGIESNLMKSGGDIPEGHYADDNMSLTVVPFRNGIMLSIAAGIAESNNLDTILIANHKGDFAQYPDCRDDFIDSMRKAIKDGTSGKVYLSAPYNFITKREIALEGKRLEVDFTTTWSCYKAESDNHCGKCGTCVERIGALKGFDKTVYDDKDFAINELKKAGEWK